MSPEMIFDEVAPQIPKNKVDKTVTVLSMVKKTVVGQSFLKRKVLLWI